VWIYIKHPSLPTVGICRISQGACLLTVLALSLPFLHVNDARSELYRNPHAVPIQIHASD
jgi:hypothetical protein